MKRLGAHDGRVTITLCIGLFAQLELFDLRDVTQLAGEGHRRVCVRDLRTR